MDLSQEFTSRPDLLVDKKKLKSARKCVPTEYAIAQGAYTSSEYTKGGVATCCWWLRSTGSYQNSAAYVNRGGSVSCLGRYVGSVTVCVRPALWINLGD